MCLSYLVINIALTFGATLFGGHVSSYWSGCNTSDIDLCFQKIEDVIAFKKTLVSLLYMVTGYPQPSYIKLSVRNWNTYCHKHKLTFSAYRDLPKATLQIDITYEKRMMHASGYLESIRRFPVSFGRLLAYSKLDGFHFNRQFREKCNMQNISVDIVTNELKKGRDILYVPETLSNARLIDEWRTYSTGRMQALIGQGYSFTSSPDDYEDCILGIRNASVDDAM